MGFRLCCLEERNVEHVHGVEYVHGVQLRERTVLKRELGAGGATPL